MAVYRFNPSSGITAFRTEAFIGLPLEAYHVSIPLQGLQPFGRAEARDWKARIIYQVSIPLQGLQPFGLFRGDADVARRFDGFQSLFRDYSLSDPVRDGKLAVDLTEFQSLFRDYSLSD